MITLPKLKLGYILFIYTVDLEETILLIDELKQFSSNHLLTTSKYSEIIYLYIDQDNVNRIYKIYSVDRNRYEEGFYNEPHYIHINFKSIYRSYNIDILMNNLDKLKEKYE